MLNNVVDNLEQCGQQNIVQCCFHQARTGCAFFAVYNMIMLIVPKYVTVHEYFMLTLLCVASFHRISRHLTGTGNWPQRLNAQ